VEQILVALSILIGILGILQGWSMYTQKKQKSNGSSVTPIFYKPDGILQKLEEINNNIKSVDNTLGKVEQRVNDCWDKLKIE
jgi:hypothetical protein